MGFLNSSFILLLTAAAAIAQITFDDEGVPLLKLPYATYRASLYDSETDFYTFGNIRYGAPAIGDLRWQKPAPPEAVDGIQNPNGTDAVQCPQAVPKSLEFQYDVVVGPDPVSEDCLFHDVTVPGKAVRGEVRDLPILVWWHGGGFVFGSKGFPLYDPKAIMESGDDGLIQISVNYRLAAFGFLGGSSVAAEGTQNAAFWDQRASLQWVQDYIHLLNGDPNAVTVMGESAGGGSIVAHLVAGGGEGEEYVPLFQRAVIQSTSIGTRGDASISNRDFSIFAEIAGCSDDDDTLECLRSKPTEELIRANREMVLNYPGGGLGPGPTIDGVFIREPTATQLAAGNYWQNVTIMIAHNSGEGSGAACAVRTIAKAYPGRTYAYRFDVPPGVHALDVFFTFWQPIVVSNTTSTVIEEGELDLVPLEDFAAAYRSYFVSFARTGDPNTYRLQTGSPATVEMELVEVGDVVENVVNIQLDEITSGDDADTSTTVCGE